MNETVVDLAEAVAAIDCAMGDHSIDSLMPNALVEVNAAVAVLRRRAEALQARVAAEIARASRADLGPDGLAKRNGFRTPVALIAAVTGSTNGDAARLVAVGEATSPRRTFADEPAPPRHPHIAEALARGTIGVPAAHAIIRMLDRVALRSTTVAQDAAERTLARQAAGLTLDQLLKVLARAEARLDPAGLEPREDERREQRSLVMFERDGMLHVTARLDAESGAPVKTAIEAFVTAELRNEADVPDAERRTIPQRQADALAMLASHVLGCADELPLGGATVVVRLSLAELQSGTGVATIDGIAQPISIAAARRMAAAGGVIPCVLDTSGEILDWGREKRLFTKAQRLALVERDGGCAMCGLPPGMTKAHHIRWWARDRGPTDLSNGVLLCESCHHRIHDNGWAVRIEGRGLQSRVWFIPPPHVDPKSAPRLGGRARYDYAA